MRTIQSSFRFLTPVLVALWVIGCGGGSPPTPDSGNDIQAPDATQDVDATTPDQTTTPDGEPDGVAPDADDTITPADQTDAGDGTTTDQTASDILEDVVGPDCDDVSDCEDALELGGCQEAACVAGSCVAVDLDDCCASAEDCNDGNECTADLCPVPGESCVFEAVASCCADQEVLLHHDFEDGDLSGFQILDSNSDDTVSWQIDTKRRHSGQASLYLGDPICHTYYNGELGNDCQPVIGPGLPTVVNITIRAPSFQVPQNGLAAGSFWMYSSVEPMLNLSGVPEADNVVVRANGFSTTTQVFDATSINKSTGGSFRFVVFDLTAFAGQTVELEIAFDTFDGSDNLHEGVYIDDLKVFTYCGEATCSDDNECSDDANSCTDNTCSSFSNGESGICAYPVPDGDCVGCLTDQDCSSEDSCLATSCQSNGVCSITTLETPECCSPQTFVSESFSGALDEWELGQSGATGWHITNNRGFGDSSSLHFGSENAPGVYSFENGAAASGAMVTLPSMTIPEDNPILTFDLLLSTEWDNAVEFNPPFPIDQLSVHISGSTSALWTSDSIQGSTNQQFQPITIDLSNYAGEVVSISLAFDSGDGSDNSAEGAFIDNLQVLSSCNKPKCSTQSDCSDEDACTTDQCDQGVCVFGAGESSCCSESSECNDGDPCTEGNCVNNACVYAPTNLESCCVDTTWSTYSFETGLGSFTTETPSTGNPNTQWKAISSENGSTSGIKAAYFGDTSNMNLGSIGVAEGSMYSPSLIIPEDGTTMLSFDVTLKTRWATVLEGDSAAFGYSQFSEDNHSDYMNAPAENSVIALSTGGQAIKEQLLFVRVNTLDGSDPVNIWYSGYVYGFTDDAATVVVDLSPWAGQYITVEWYFSSYFDPILSYEGVYIDNVAISSVCETGLECVGAQDCPFDGDTCSYNACDNFQCSIVPGPGEGCCVPEVVWTVDFENMTMAVAGFTQEDATPGDSVSWHLVTYDETIPNQWPPGVNPKHSGLSSIYYGNLDAFPQNYDSGTSSNSSSLLSAPFQLPAQGPFELAFWLMHDIEAFAVEFERFRIEIIPTDGEAEAAVLIDTYSFSGSYINPLQNLEANLWNAVSLGGFSAMGGKEVQLRIIFDTLDALNNDTLGLFIDDISVNRSCP